jgi:hypothetical protein
VSEPGWLLARPPPPTSLTHAPDNDAVMGFDPMPRAPLDLPAYYKNAKDNSYVCKAHANNECKQCCESLLLLLYPPCLLARRRARPGR